MPQEASDYIFFWKTNEEYGFLSQWAYSPFKAEVLIDEKMETCDFATAEHWMMFKKAQLFGDTAIAQEVLSIPAGSSDLAQVKALGRKVQNFDEETWVKERYNIVVEGNMHKFRGNEVLGEKLAKTGEKILVEASPRDRIWGVGFGAKNALAQKDRWGQNLLGKALEDVRRQLRAL